MWQPLYDPPFVLAPNHAAVFRMAAGMFSDFVGWESWEDDSPGIGIAVFDNLSQHQKQTAILIVAKALLDPACEPPDVTAVLAATVDAVYIHLESAVEMEIGHETNVRQLILNAVDELDCWGGANDGLPPDEKPSTRPAPACPDMSEWGELVEALRSERTTRLWPRHHGKERERPRREVPMEVGAPASGIGSRQARKP